MESYETITVESSEAIAWITLNRPDVHNAFNSQMQRELRSVWRSLRYDESVRVAVVTGAGEKAFCTGIDRAETISEDARGVGADPLAADASNGDRINVGATSSTHFMFDDPGTSLGPKSCDLFKPVIAAVNGMACGGAFYILGEVEFIIASENATFFDPHVTYGMTASFEPMQMMYRMPFGEIMRMSLLGNSERLSARRAFDIGLVSEVVPPASLHEAARWAAEAIAAAPPLAVEGTVRSLWTARELSRAQALSLGFAFIGLGTSQDSIAEGQRAFSSGARKEWRLR